MNKKIWLLAISIIISSNVYSQIDAEMSASLQDGEKMTPYFGKNAFVEAYTNAPDSGAIITLSAGNFNTLQEPITKTVSIYGVYGFSDQIDRTRMDNIIVSADNIMIEGVQIITLKNDSSINNLHLRRCTIDTLHANYTHNKTVIEQCLIKTDISIFHSKNMTIMNSVVQKFKQGNSVSNLLFITNSSVNIQDSIPFAIYRNNVIINNTIRLSSPSEFYGNSFTSSFSFDAGCQYRNNSTASISTADPFNPGNVGDGEDGTLRGPIGGKGFSRHPGIPRIVSQEVSKNTDSDGNLIIKLQVSANH